MSSDEGQWMTPKLTTSPNTPYMTMFTRIIKLLRGSYVRSVYMRIINQSEQHVIANIDVRCKRIDMLKNSLHVCFGEYS